MIQLNFGRNPGFLHNRHIRRNRQIIQKISSMCKLLTNRVVPAQNFLAKIDKFSQKSVSFRKNCKFSPKIHIFRKNRHMFAKIGKFSQKNRHIFAKNLHIFAKICKFSQKFGNVRKNRQIFAKLGRFSQKSGNFRKNLEIFAKIWKFSQKFGNVRKNRQIFANICKFVILNFRDPGPQANSKIQKFSNFRVCPPNQFA